MRRWLVIIVWALGSQALAHKPPAIQILQDRGFASSDYSNLTLTAVTAMDFLAGVLDDSAKDALTGQVTELDQRISKQLGVYCQMGFPGGGGHGSLGITLVLSAYAAGSSSEKTWKAFGADAGRCQYEVQLRDDKDVEVADFVVRAPIQVWIDVSGEASGARAPKTLVEEIQGFFSSH